jgi:hypothetical protein
MQDLEALAGSWTNGALVFIRTEDTGRPMVRPAAFVYATPTGFAWIEPSYADPAGSATPALHFRDGTPREEAGGGFSMVTTDAERVTVLPNVDGDDLVDGALGWFAGYLADKGVDWAAERERLRDQVSRL